MGVTVREKPKGSGVWWLFINHNGKRKAKKVGDKRTADQVARKLNKKIAIGDFKIKESKNIIRFKKIADEWIEIDVKTLRAISTYERYNNILEKHVLPEFRNKAIDEISKGDIKAFLTKKMKSGLSRSSISLFRDVLGGVFNRAIDHEILKDSPVRGVTKGLGLNKIRGKGVDPLNFEETQIFLDSCQKLRPDYYVPFFTALRTGMRLGELLALRWGDVDFNSMFVWVKRSYKIGRFTETKNKKFRRVDMSTALSTLLKGL